MKRDARGTRVLLFWCALGALTTLHANPTPNDFPTAERVLGVQACMRQYPGPFHEMLHKCACSLDTVAAQMSFAEYVELSTIANAMTIAGERGNEMRDNESLKAPLARFKRLKLEADKACFINPP